MFEVGDVFFWRDFEFSENRSEDRNKFIIVVGLPDAQFSDYLYILTTSQESKDRRTEPGTQCASNTRKKGHKFEVTDQQPVWFTKPTWVVFDTVRRVQQTIFEQKVENGLVRLDFRISQTNYTNMLRCFQNAVWDIARDDFQRINSCKY